MIANNVDHWCIAPARIVQVGNTIGHAGTEMEQRCRRFSGHSADAVGSTGADTFEQGQYRFHSRYRIQGLNQMHFRGAGVSYTKFYAAVGERIDQCGGAVHSDILIASVVAMWTSIIASSSP